MRSGFSADFLLDLDVLSYDALVDRVLFVDMSKRKQRIWDTYIATQCVHKSVVDYSDGISKGQVEEKQKNDQNKFINDLSGLTGKRLL